MVQAETLYCILEKQCTSAKIYGTKLPSIKYVYSMIALIRNLSSNGKALRMYRFRLRDFKRVPLWFSLYTMLIFCKLCVSYNEFVALINSPFKE